LKMFSLIVISAVFWLQWRFRRNVPFGKTMARNLFGS